MEIIESEYDIRKTISDIVFLIENRVGGKDIKIVVDIDKSIPSLLIGDALRIRQILINLMNNSVKFTEKGSITLSIVKDDKTDDEYILTLSGNRFLKRGLPGKVHLHKAGHHPAAGRAGCQHLLHIPGADAADGINGNGGEGANFFKKLKAFSGQSLFAVGLENISKNHLGGACFCRLPHIVQTMTGNADLRKTGEAPGLLPEGRKGQMDPPAAECLCLLCVCMEKTGNFVPSADLKNFFGQPSVSFRIQVLFPENQCPGTKFRHP